jgi:mannose-6-phosphate isomerase-like protein (cupin superfamily)
VKPMTGDGSPPDGVIVLPRGEGRTYDCGSITAVFKADGAETDARYSVSEWWIEAGGAAVDPHAHEANDELFYVLAGTMTFRVGEREVDAEAGTFLRIPAGVVHGFRNRTGERSGVLNVFIPGAFEENMPAIAAWYRENAGG